MGRKIPAKKHRGVKDPAKQQQERWKKIKTKINAPPRDPDEQLAPRSLARLFEGPEPKSKKKLSRPTENKQNVISKSKNPVSSLKRLPGETGRAFSLRINSAIRTLHDRTDDSYPLDLEEEEDAKGVHMSERNEQRARKRRRQLKSADGGGGNGAGGEGGAPRGQWDGRSRGQKLTLIKKARKEKIEQEKRSAVAEVRYERVQFGEVAHAPPALSVLPRRAAPLLGAPRPGRRELLLTALLEPGAARGAEGGARGATAARGAGAATGAVERERRERARLQAVDAYRALKKQRTNAHPTVII